MKLSLNVQLADGYKSPSQRARVITEGWFAQKMFCPSCPADRLVQTTDSTRVVDFYCQYCGAEYQLKSCSGGLGRKLRDAAYQPMMERIQQDRSPHFAFMHYDNSRWVIQNLLLVPGHFITPNVIEKCKPLSETARRAGWTGCNILSDKIPDDGRVFVIRQHEFVPAVHVRAAWNTFKWLAEKKAQERGWLADVLRCVRMLGQSFTLSDMYRFEKELAESHPNNRHVRDKVRQQLQYLRDRGIILFLGRGKYRVV